ncbi:restriction endonuclease subunit S [Endozoicomonas acroporae]|uniref:restriction endonuclease subunit S n=1 Tax=Endozoicomonas acroporae TaxID=1701104 RepID=UPI003D7A80CA
MDGKYKSYSEYNPSGIDWLAEIPKHWDTSKLRYLFDFGKGLSITKEHLQDEGVPCVSYGEIHSKYGFEVDPLKNPLKCVDTKYLESSPNALLKFGDMVFADTSEDIDGSGNFTQLIGDTPTFAGYHTIIARPYDRESNRFFAYLFDSQEFRTQIRHAVKGVKVFSITQAILRGLGVWLPSHQERTNIANFLDHETAKIDTLIEEQKTLIRLLQEKRQAVISHAVTKGLNPDVLLKDSGVEWLGQVPGHWDIPKLQYVTRRIGDGLHATPQYEDNTGFYFVNGNNLVNGRIFIGSSAKEVPETEYRKHYIELDDNSVLLSINGTVGNVALYSGERIILGKSAAYINCRKTVKPNYLMLYLQTSHLKRYFDLEVTGTTIFNLSLNSIRQMKVCMPPDKEQVEITAYCQAQNEKYRNLIGEANKQIELMQERRTALISAAVTGKIDVRDWVVPAHPCAHDIAASLHGTPDAPQKEQSPKAVQTP